MQVFFVLLVVLLRAGAGGASPADDIDALLQFKKPITPVSTLSSWQKPSSSSVLSCPATFLGITCDPTIPGGGAVTGISLVDLSIAGEVKFSTLNLMSNLQNITLSGSSLSGRIVPGLFTALTSLRSLDLSGNRFYGSVPDKLSSITAVTRLSFAQNQFSGWFPAASLSALQQLRYFDLRSNALEGNIGEILSNLRNAEHLDLSANNFSGSVNVGAMNLDDLGNTLRYMNFSWNAVQGNFFSLDEVTKFKSLEVLDVSWNKLGGSIPSLNGLDNLKIFRAVGNLFVGAVPEGLYQSILQLKEIDLSLNHFTGSVNSINSTTLRMLNLSSNALDGLLPASIGGCTSLDLSKNMLSGDIAVISSWENTLELIDLSFNKLTGSYPNEAPWFQNIVSLRMSNNFLAGSLPDVFGNFSKLSILDLSMNKFTGPILSVLFEIPSLTYLNLSTNYFDGMISLQRTHLDASIVSPSALESLDLSCNSLSGALPPKIGNFQGLRFLIVRNNSLSGEIPSEINQLDVLEVLDLSKNNFNGNLPDLSLGNLRALNVSYNDLHGIVPRSLTKFPIASFFPGNPLLHLPPGMSGGTGNTAGSARGGSGSSLKFSVRLALIIISIGALMLLLFIVFVLYIVRSKHLCGRVFKGRDTAGDTKFGKFGDNRSTKASFSNDRLLTSATSMSAQKELLAEILDENCVGSKRHGEPHNADVLNHPVPAYLPSSPQLADPRFAEPVVLEVYSPDRLVGELTLLDASLLFTAEDLSRAPAEILGRGSHGTTYKATLDNGHMLIVKWLRVGLVKHKKDFVKEGKKFGAIRHPNIVPWRGFYGGPKEQERLIISDFVPGDNLALYLYESTPRRYSRLSVAQRLKIAIDVARGLFYLHNEKNLPHGNLKPTNVFLTGSELTAKLADFGLHRLLTHNGIAEQMLNLGAYGYRAPELASSIKPAPSFKADVYALGVILMEMLTRKSAGDIISGQSGAVDLTDWVQMCNREGRGTDCFDRDITGLEESPRVMDELLAISLRCILPINERPNVKTVLDDLTSITM